MLATPGSVASQSLWPSWFAPGLSGFRHIPLARASFLFTRAWRSFTTVAILPHGVPSAFESCHLHVTFRMTRRLAQVNKLPLRIWPLSASGRLVAPGLSRIRHCLLAKTSFLSALVRRLFAAVSFSLSGSRAFSRVNRSCCYTRIVSCGLTMVCKQPLSLWLPSASGRRFCARSPAHSALFSCEKVLLVRFGVAAIHSRPILPRGLPSVFESLPYLFYTGWLGDFALWSGSNP